MAEQRAEGKWREMKGRIREQFGELTDDELDEARGHVEKLAGRVQQRYGIAKEEAEKRLKEIERSVSD